MNQIIDARATFNRRRRRDNRDKTSRNRERKGSSDHSWFKHQLDAKAVSGQVCAFRARCPTDRILLVDGNAGEGIGVKKTQSDLFEGDTLSQPTAQILTDLAERVGGADVVLCDNDPRKRAMLWQRFPQAIILADHREIPYIIRPEHHYALWLSDPSGYAGHGVEHMRAVAERVLCDFVVNLNEHALRRVFKTKGPKWDPHRVKYRGMLEPDWWLDKLGKRLIARTRLIRASPNFHFRVMVISNFLADSARRAPFVEIITKKNIKKETRA